MPVWESQLRKIIQVYPDNELVLKYKSGKWAFEIAPAPFEGRDTTPEARIDYLIPETGFFMDVEVI